MIKNIYMKTYRGVIALLVLIFFAFSSGFAQEVVQKNGYFYKKDMLYTGAYTEYYDNGNIKFKLNIKNGLEVGEVITYFEQGQKH